MRLTHSVRLCMTQVVLTPWKCALKVDVWVTEIKEEEQKFSLTMVEGLTGGHKFQFVLQDLEVLKRTCLASLVTTDFEEGACLVLEFFFLNWHPSIFFKWLGHALKTTPTGRCFSPRPCQRLETLRRSRGRDARRSGVAHRALWDFCDGHFGQRRVRRWVGSQIQDQGLWPWDSWACSAKR